MYIYIHQEMFWVSNETQVYCIRNECYTLLSLVVVVVVISN